MRHITKDTNILIRARDQKGQKYETAKKYGTKIMEYKEFKQYLDQRLDETHMKEFEKRLEVEK